MFLAFGYEYSVVKMCLRIEFVERGPKDFEGGNTRL